MPQIPPPGRAGRSPRLARLAAAVFLLTAPLTALAETLFVRTGGNGINNLSEIYGGSDPNDARSRYEIVDFATEPDGNKVTARVALPSTSDSTRYRPSMIDIGEFDTLQRVTATDASGEPIPVIKRDPGVYDVRGTGELIILHITICPDDEDRPVGAFLLQVLTVPVRD